MTNAYIEKTFKKNEWETLKNVRNKVKAGKLKKEVLGRVKQNAERK